MTLLRKTETTFPLEVVTASTDGVFVTTHGTCGGRVVACDNPACWAEGMGVEIADNGFIVHCGACGSAIDTTE